VARAAAAGAFRSGSRPESATRLPTTYWLRLEVLNPEPRDATWLVAYGYPLITRIELHEQSRGGFTSRVGGLAVPTRERTIQHAGPYHSAPVTLGPGESRTLYLRVDTRSGLLAEPEAWQPAALALRQWAITLALGIGMGVLLILATLRLYAQLALRVKVGISGTSFLLCFTGLMATLGGVAPTFLWPSAGRWWLSANPALAGLTAALGFQFVRGFLSLRAREPRLDRATALVAWLAAAAALWSLLDRGRGAVAVAAVAAPGLVLVAAATARGVARGERDARLLAVASAVILVSGLGFAASILGIAPPSPAAPLGLMAGFVVGAAFLTVALTDRALGDSQRAREALQEQVASRTRDLNDAVARLETEAASRRQTLAALQESEQRLRVLFDTSPDAVTLNSAEDGTYLDVSRGFTEQTGWAREEVVGRTATQIGLWVRPEDREAFRRPLLAGETVRNLEVRFRLRNGRVAEALISAQVTQVQGKSYIIAVARDISEWKRSEEEKLALQDQLRQAQKMEAIGRLAGGVAHDFNNLLTVIVANTGLALSEVSEGDLRDGLLEVQDAARRAGALTRQLLAFGRRQVIAPRPLDLSGHVEGMRAMLTRLLGEDLELTFALAPGVAPVMADATQVEQVVLNLATNARDAVSQGGRIRVATRGATLEGDEGQRRSGRYGLVEVSDTGRGMAPEVQARIFEPFFTTGTRGTGLGLATVYGVAQQHGGFVEVESEPGKGSTFRVWFPAAPAGEVGAPASPGPVPGRGAPQVTGTVLLAEDEPAVREVARQVLARAGWSVLAASDGADALRILERHAGPLDALVTDVVMPRMNGRELARAAALRRPGLPVLFVSGHSEEVITRNGLLEPGLSLLRKPFEPEELLRALGELLERSTTPSSSA